MPLPKLVSLALRMRPKVKTQAEAWQVYRHFKDSVLKDDVELVDFRLHRKDYYGVSGFSNSVNLTLKPNNVNGQQIVAKLDAGDVPAMEDHTFIKAKAVE